MFINFARELFELLVKDEFVYIKQADNTLVYDTEALSLYKDKGSAIYIVTIINANKMEKAAHSKMMDGFLHIMDKEDRAQLILMNVIANDKDGIFAIEEDFASGKRSYIFNYNVDLDAEAVTTEENQPDILGMEEKIYLALKRNDERYVNGTHLASLQEELDNKYALPVKSGNSALTFFLIAANIIGWILIELFGGSGSMETLVSFGALSRELVINQHEYYRLFTAMFVHIGIMHLVGNCLSLYIFGSRVERHCGKFMFILLYITAGMVGNLLTITFMSGLSAGASGAIFGLLGAILSISYRTKRSVGGLSPYLILLLCVYSVGMGFVIPVVNNFAHIGGFAVGILFGAFVFDRTGGAEERAPQENNDL